MNVYDNLAFGLKMRKVPKEEIDKRVKVAAGILGIEMLLGRKPKQLSSGSSSVRVPGDATRSSSAVEEETAR